MQNKTILATILAGASALALGSVANAGPMVAKSSFVSPAAASQPVDFEVFLPLRNTAGLDDLLAKQQDKTSSSYHKWLTPDQFKAQFGPTDAKVARVSAALKARGFSVAAVHTRSIEVTGTADQVAKTFSTTLSRVQPQRGVARLVANSGIVVPAALSEEGAVVVNFSQRPPLHTYHTNVGQVSPDNRYGAVGPYWFDDLKQAYSYPAYTTTTDGSGVSAAVLISNDARDADIAAFFNHENFTTITGKPAPTITHVAINGGAPFDINASFEASLDVQQILGGAPGAHVTLVNIPDLSDENIIAGYLYIVESNAYSIVNSSFGGCELAYSAAYNGGQNYYGILDTYDTLFKQGNAQGITFVASSGDEGGLECPDTSYFSGNPNAKPIFIPSVSFPADSPNVTAVGGGNLVTTPGSSSNLNSAYVSENGNGDPEIPHDPYGFGINVSGGYWGAGGGISDHFAAPDYQSKVNAKNIKFRTLPDVGMQVGGCPGGISQLPCGPNRSAAVVADGVGIGGGYYGVIGTSVSSPEFVGAIALYEQTAGRQGNLNPFLYNAGQAQTKAKGSTAPSFNRPTDGFDGVYTAKQPSVNYNYIFGNGTPMVSNLFGLSPTLAGKPQTPSNP